MSELVRFGVAVEASLLDAFDRHIAGRGYPSRSEALRDLVRAELARDAWDRGEPTVATISLIYDHHVRELTERLVEIQHEHGERVISATHVHLDHDHCLEVILAKGPADALKRMADRLIGAKGVLAGDVTGLSIVGAAAAKEARSSATSAPLASERKAEAQAPRASAKTKTKRASSAAPRSRAPERDSHEHPHTHPHRHDHGDHAKAAPAKGRARAGSRGGENGEP